MLFRSTDLLNDFERLTKGLNFGPDFDQAVDQAVEEISTAFTGATNKFAGAANTDIVRSDKALTISVDLPGVSPDDVDLTVDGRKLTISAHRDFVLAEGEDHVHAGRRHGSFTRSFKLAEDLDIDALTARSEHGVLTVTVPVIAAPEPRKIEISH
jgi:HSP20 family protein